MDETEVSLTHEAREIPTGVAVAAMLATMIGLLTLALVNPSTTASKDFSSWVFGIGKLWVPGAEGIEPYSGKETFMMVGWLGSWIVLHFALRKREVNVRLWFAVFLVGMAITSLLLWPPITHLVLGK